MVAGGGSGGPEECLMVLNTMRCFHFRPQGVQQTAWKQGFPACKNTHKAQPKRMGATIILLITKES